MRNPVVSILIPYLVFILLFENQIFENALIVNIFLFYIFLKIFIYSYFLLKKNKILFLGIFEILLFIILLENYDFKILQMPEDTPKKGKWF